MEDNVINITNKINDATFHTPEMCVKECLKNDIGKRGAFKEGKKLFIVCLDDNDEKYNISWNQAGMSMSEILALLDITRTFIKKEMGF